MRVLRCLLLAVPAVASLAAAAEPAREPCAHRNPLRSPYFGALHVHTQLSLDASTQGARNRPADAYRFARGERLGIQPYTASGKPLRSVA